MSLFAAAFLASSAAVVQANRTLCMTQLTRNPALLLFHRPTRRLLLIKAGRKIRQITVAGTVENMLPDGVYTILREREDLLRSRFQFSPAVGPRIAWKGKVLFAEGPMSQVANSRPIRLPLAFAKDLVRMTSPGAVLVVASSPSAVQLFDTIGLFDANELASAAQPNCRPAAGWKPQVEISPEFPVAVIISERDRAAYVYEGGDLRGVYSLYVRYPHRETGRHLFIAVKPDKSKPRRSWQALSLAGGGFVVAPPVTQADNVLNRFEFEREFQSGIDAYINRGVVLLVIERSARGESKSDRLITLLRAD